MQFFSNSVIEYDKSIIIRIYGLLDPYEKRLQSFKKCKVLHPQKEDIKRDGTFDKWKYIETKTFQQFQKARNCLEQVHKIVENIYYAYHRIKFKKCMSINNAF